MILNERPLTLYGTLWVPLILLIVWPRVTPAAANGKCLQPLHTALQKTAAGRCLLEAVAGPGDRHGVVGLDLLVGDLEMVIGARFGLIIDGTDPALVEAASELRKMPRRLRNEPIAAVMVLVDEWVRRIVTSTRSPSLLEELRRNRPPKDQARVCRWLETYFPVWFQFASSTLTPASGRCHFDEYSR